MERIEKKIALTKKNEISFLKNFNLPLIKIMKKKIPAGKAGKGLRALKSKAPEVAKRMGYKKGGLYANIHAKRKRGGKMKKKGAKGAPTAANFRRAAQTAKKK